MDYRLVRNPVLPITFNSPEAIYVVLIIGRLVFYFYANNVLTVQDFYIQRHLSVEDNIRQHLSDNHTGIEIHQTNENIYRVNLCTSYAHEAASVTMDVAHPKPNPEHTPEKVTPVARVTPVSPDTNSRPLLPGTGEPDPVN